MLHALAPNPGLLFLPCHPWLPPISSSTSVSSNHLTPFQIHPHQLADSVHFTRRAQCSDPRGSMADKSMLSLFSMPLLPLIFFFCYFAVCGDLNFAQLNRVHFQGQIVAWRQSLMLALDGDYQIFIYEVHHWNRGYCGVCFSFLFFFYRKRTWIYWYCEPSFRWGMPKDCLDIEVFHFENRANTLNRNKANTLWSYLLRKN